MLPSTVATALLNKAFYRVHGLQHNARVVAVFAWVKGEARMHINVVMPAYAVHTDGLLRGQFAHLLDKQREQLPRFDTVA